MVIGVAVLSSARNTYALAFPVYVEICSRKGMAMLTVCFSSIPRTCSRTTQYIHSNGNRFKMVWIAAPWVPAEMVNTERLWQFLLRCNLPNQTMNIRAFPSPSFLAVAIGVNQGTHPATISNYEVFLNAFRK